MHLYGLRETGQFKVTKNAIVRTPSQLETNSFEESPDHDTELRPSMGG